VTTFDANTGGRATERKRIAVVTAGLSKPSSTRLLADRLAAATGRLAEADTQVIELRELAAEIAQNMVTGFPGPRLREAIDAVTSADGLIAVTPVFTGSYSGLFKSFFDVLEEGTLTDTPVLIGATGGTARHSLMLEHAMRPMFAYLRAVVIPTAVFAASEDWGTGETRGTSKGGGSAGSATGLSRRIDRAGRELADLVAGREPAAQRDELHDFVPFDQLIGGS
jgi:FMN reductase